MELREVLSLPFFWVLVASLAVVTLAFGVHWAADKWIAGASDDRSFYSALFFFTLTVAVFLVGVMPS